MKANHLLFPLLLWGMTAQAKSTTPAVTASNNLNFIENKGQVRDQYGKSRDDIDFHVGSAGVSVFIGNGQLHYQWATVLTKNSPDEDHLVQTGMYRMDVTLIGANIHAQVSTESKQSYYERYYQPTFGEQGIIALAYQKITYKDVYPNIDWVLYVKNNTIEYDFVVRPGGKASDIKLQYGGATAISVDKTGKLTATTPMGSVSENAPVSYQSDGKQVNTRFVLNGDKLSFSADDYKGTLVIDPTLSWSTYYGGSGDETERAGCVTGDNYGYGYLSGHTFSTSDIATTGSYQDTLTGGTDAFLVKFNSSGVRQWATYYGGPNSENIYGTSCDPAGNVYISGYTNSSSGIATTGAYQVTNGGTDAFLVKFDSSGARLWGTYFGGSSTEHGSAVACDKNSNVYLTGYTQSTSGIATTGAYQTTAGGGHDCFLAKFNSAGTIQWATYYGGSSTDEGQAVACDTSNNVFFTGFTQSASGIATTGAYQTTIGGGKDVFLAKFDSVGNMQWATYYGGAGLDIGFSLICDNKNNAYITGNTVSASGIATVGSFQDTLGGSTSGDGFLAKFSSTGSLDWGTYYGGSGGDQGEAVSYSSLGYVYVAGFSSSTNGIATVGSFQDTLNGVEDAFLVKFDTSGNRIWGTYFGGESDDQGYGVHCGPLSKVFLGGTTSSYGLLTTAGCYQSTYGGGSLDGFLAMFNDCLLTQPDTLIGHDTVCRGITYTYSVPAIAGSTSYTWALPAGWTGSSTADTIHVVVGTHSDTIKVAANFACGSSTQLIKVITVNPLPTIIPAGTNSICNGDSLTLTASLGTTYQWLQSGTVIGGATSHTYNVHTGNHYSVVVTSAIGCADTSASDTVIVHPTPVPVIAASGTVLSTGSFVSYQWSLDGVAITGAVNQTYTMVIDTGNYAVTLTDSNGCTGTSVVYNPEGVNNIIKAKTVRVYPNPTTGMIYVDAAQKVNVSISGIDGRQIAFYKMPKQIDISNLSDGMYILRITDAKGLLLNTEKLVKTKTW